MEFAERNGITVFGTYIDRALSAKTDNRPEFQRMIKDSYHKLFDTVLVWKLDRFARNRYDGRGLTENALKGKMNGGGLTFGYRMKDQRLEIDEATAPVVVEIFTRYADGERMTDIAKDLTRRGIRTSQGNKITLNVVHYLLKNRRYIGEYKFRDMVIHDAIPPIVSEELFNRVQEIMARNQKAPAMRKAEDDYILTTRLFCGKCGTFMVGESGKSHTGTVHRYYKCSHAKRKMGCDKSHGRRTHRPHCRCDLEHSCAGELQAAAAQCSSERNRSRHTEYAQCHPAGHTYSLHQRAAGSVGAGKRRDQSRHLQRGTAKAEDHEGAHRLLDKQIPRYQFDGRCKSKAACRELCECLFVYDDKVVFTFNYKDGSKTATIDEINAELGSDCCFLF